MGEDAKLIIGQGIKIMVDDKPVGIAKQGMLTCSIEDDGSTKDSGAWENPMRHTYEITGTMTIPPEEAEQFRKFIESMKFSRKELRKMFHAVTHGGAIVFQSYFNAEYDNGETEEFVRNVYINRPRILRKMIAANRRFRFKYDIVPHFDPKDKIILSEFEQ